jgi:hypothetical protein
MNKTTLKSKIKKLPIIGGLIKLYCLPNLVAVLRIELSNKEAERHAREQALNNIITSLSVMITNLSQKVEILTIKTDNLQLNIDNFKKIEIINGKIKRDNELNIIPIIIDCEYPQFNQFLEPVIHELTKISNQKFDLFFCELNNGDGASYFCYNKENVFPVSICSKIIGNIIFLSPIILNKGPESALKIIIDHGICSAKYTFHAKESFENFNIYCVTGDLNEDKIHKNLEKYGLLDKVEIIKGGYPKSDYLFNDTYSSKNKIFTNLNLDSRKKTLLFAPSWEKGLSLMEFGVSLVDTILQNEDYNLIVKLHPNSFTSLLNVGINWKEQFEPYSNNPNFSFVLDLNINEALLISDIMITDLSSVALEFLALDKLVVYLDCPKFEEIYNELYPSFRIEHSYKELLENPYCNAGRHVGLINYDHKKILEDISFLIENPDYKINERKEYSKQILSNKGHASEFYSKMIVSKFIEYSGK